MNVKDSAANRKQCICKDCPSHPAGKELLYCSVGKSCCDISAKGCICNSCPVYAKNRLEGIYFCDKEKVGSIVMRKKSSNEDVSFYQSVADIKEIAATGQSIVRSMGSQKKMPFSLNDIHFIPAQVGKIPLNSEDSVNTSVVLGPGAKKPLKLSSPILVSGMSFGATSKNVKLVISKVASTLKIGFNSGEGGILPEEFGSADYLIGQYATGRFGVNEDILKKVAAVEIRFGQGAYPGKGSYLPASKMSPEVANLRGLKGGEAAYSPAHHHDIRNSEELKKKVEWLRKITQGVPIGAKIGCGNVEADIKALANAGVDFIAIDGFGGGTGATEFIVRENVGIPLIAALPRAVACINKLGKKGKISLIAAGGLRTSADFAKCLALGADAVYIGTAALIAINCEQYRICHTGLCPTGITTHNPVLTGQLDVEKGAAKLSNFIRESTIEIANFARIVGKIDVKKLSREDLVSLSKDLSSLAGIKWLDGN
jgi:methylamine---glutamate N-methyltransferase subunit C